MANERSPIIVARRRPIPKDLSLEILRQGKESGVQMRQFQESVMLQEAQGPGSAGFLNEEVSRIRSNTDIELSLKTIGLGFAGRPIPLTPATPAIIIPPNRYPRGYLILNPAFTTGFSSQVTFYPSALRANGFTTVSTSFNVSGVETVRLFLDISAITLTPTLIVDAETQDPLSGNFADSQNDLFSSAATVGTFYASLGQLGVDQTIRLQATVGNAAGDDITFSISGLFKGGQLTPSGSTVFIGGIDVNTTWGYPILPGQEKVFYLMENVSLYAITPTDPLDLRVFQLK